MSKKNSLQSPSSKSFLMLEHATRTIEHDHPGPSIYSDISEYKGGGNHPQVFI